MILQHHQTWKTRSVGCVLLANEFWLITTSMYTQLPKTRYAWRIWPAEDESSRTANHESSGHILETLLILSSSSVSVFRLQSPALAPQESHTTHLPMVPVGMTPLPALYLVVVLLWSTGCLQCCIWHTTSLTIILKNEHKVGGKKTKQVQLHPKVQHL